MRQMAVNTSRRGGAFLYSRRGLPLRGRGAYGIHRAFRPSVPRVVFAPLRGQRTRPEGARFDGPSGRGFLRGLSLTRPSAVRVVVGALQKEGAPVWIKPLQPPWRAKGKQANRAFGAREMHPYPRLRRYFSTGKRLTRFSVAQGLPTNRVRLPPRRGKFWRRYASELRGTLFSTHSAPVRGGKGTGFVGKRSDPKIQ